jgi:preprotein translocase subunit SecG
MLMFVMILIIMVAVLLTLIILAQNPKGGGLSSQFGGSGSSSQMMGVKRTTDLLEKITWGFGIALVVLSLSSSFLIGTTTDTSGIVSPNVERAQERNVLPNLNTPAPGEGIGDSAVLDMESLTEEGDTAQ